MAPGAPKSNEEYRESLGRAENKEIGKVIGTDDIDNDT